MKRGSRFLIGLVTAGITFGALMLSLGQSQFNKYGHGHHGCHTHDTQHGDGSVDGNTQK